jgi:hypothetical protein
VVDADEGVADLELRSLWWWIVAACHGWTAYGNATAETAVRVFTALP